MLEILKAFSKILSQSVEYKLKSKEAYLAGGGRVVLRVSWGPGRGVECWFPLNGRVLGTRGSRGRGKIFTGLVVLVNPEIKHSLNHYTQIYFINCKRKSAIVTLLTYLFVPLECFELQ